MADIFSSLISRMTSKNFDEDAFETMKPTRRSAPSEALTSGRDVSAEAKEVSKVPATVTMKKPDPASMISVRRTTTQNETASTEASLKKIFDAPEASSHPSGASSSASSTPIPIGTSNPSKKQKEASSGLEHVTTPADEQTKPLQEWLHSKLKRTVLEKLKMERLTRVQQLAWGPMSIPDRDVLVRSETGSGKTFAYLGPLLHRLLTECDTANIDRSAGTLIIILAPTRELVEQVAQVAQTLLQNAQFITVGMIHGGDNRHKEKARLRKGIHVLVATPGRLQDHLKTTAAFTHSGLQTIVLDEADRLLDMGFEKSIREIMEIIHPQKRVLVSATITDAVERLSHFALQNPIRVGETEDTFQVPASLRQHFSIVPAKHRLATLVSFLRSQLDAGSKKIVVFMSTSDSVEFHYLLLSRLQNPYSSRKRVFEGGRQDTAGTNRGPRKSFKKLTAAANRHLGDDDDENGVPEDVVDFDDDEGNEEDGQEAQRLEVKDSFLPVNIFKLHGNMNQVDRASVFHAFKHGADQGVLICTDVAARGLDMPHIDWIVHFDPPSDERCYIHRVGRTARIGRVGDSILFLMPHEAPYADYLSKFIAMPIEEKKHEALLYYLTKLDPSSHHSYMQSTATLERKIGYTIREDPEGLSKVNLFAYQSFIRAYSGYPRQVRHFFNADMLHLGHIAHAFGIDAKPSELRQKLRTVVRDERKLSRDTSRFKRGARMEVETKETYHSAMVNKTLKNSRDYHEWKRATTPAVAKPLQFTEFDA
eukprot:CAMPEP_0176404840 /NCGR_PEP_ID=MMETSP0127-20121128/25_1 /TAXON_ID=938130 /ORGANISM="Platyophrya macrostoma, Strain WH" /LENGTH=762 /DNA_ID=CAMNT_0017783871 /DNA_START=32 /DNA_END=2320 /DNA_ORIENTATION=+